MRKLFTLLMLLVLFVLPARVHAQSAVVVDTLDVSIWPEYDTPSVLVIYKIALSPSASLPAQVTFRVPARVGKLSAVAVGNTADTVSDSGVDYKFTPGAEFTEVTVNAAARFVQVEYYDENLKKNGNQHEYVFDWQGNLAASNFRFELRQPLQSSNLTVEPALSNTIVDADGFHFSEYKKTGLAVDEKLIFTVNYQRDTDSPSTSFLTVQPSAPLDQAVTGQSTWTTYLPWGLGGLGVALLLVAGWVYWTTSRSTNKSAGVGRKRHSINNLNADVNGDDQQVHCAQCGKRAQDGDRFCRACGARIRRIEE
jgi:hypothetical protein